MKQQIAMEGENKQKMDSSRVVRSKQDTVTDLFARIRQIVLGDTRKNEQRNKGLGSFAVTGAGFCNCLKARNIISRVSEHNLVAILFLVYSKAN